MSENTTETRTVQSYRHSARRSLKQAQEAISLRTSETKEVYTLVNGMIEEVIRGRTGLSQDEQVSRLSEAHDALVTNMETLPDKIAAAKEAVIAILDGWETTILAKAQEATDTLAEARDFAAERDFDAWQAQKKRGYVAPSPDTDEDDDADEEDYEDED